MACRGVCSRRGRRQPRIGLRLRQLDPHQCRPGHTAAWWSR